MLASKLRSILVAGLSVSTGSRGEGMSNQKETKCHVCHKPSQKKVCDTCAEVVRNSKPSQRRCADCSSNRVCEIRQHATDFANKVGWAMPKIDPRKSFHAALGRLLADHCEHFCGKESLPEPCHTLNACPNCGRLYDDVHTSPCSQCEASYFEGSSIETDKELKEKGK